MSWVATDQDGTEVKFEHEPERVIVWGIWCRKEPWNSVECLPKGSIKELIGRDLCWEDEAVELKEE